MIINQINIFVLLDSTGKMTGRNSSPPKNLQIQGLI